MFSLFDYQFIMIILSIALYFFDDTLIGKSY